MLAGYSKINYSKGPAQASALGGKPVEKRGHWHRWILKYRESGSKNRRSFCESFGLNYHQFQYWHRKFNQSKAAESSEALIRVKVPSSAQSSSEALCKIELRSGHRLWFYDPDELSRYLSRLIE